MKIKAFFSVLVCLFASCFSFAYDNLVIFGDSLSDVGNIPSTNPLSDAGRWSNGLVWNEYLAGLLGVSVPQKSSNYSSGESISAGNTNFANAGALSHADSPIDPGIYSVNLQIDSSQVTENPVGFNRYGANFGADDLVAIWGGANDWILSPEKTMDYALVAAQAAANAMSDNVEALLNYGAKNLVIINLPDISNTPRFEGEQPAHLESKTYSQTFNQLYSEKISEIKAEHSDVNFFIIDIETILNEILENYESYGFEHLYDTLSNAGEGADASKYIFFDDIHPTTHTHEIIAQAIASQIVVPEPATYAIYIGLLALGVAIFSRRLKK